jgi:type IV pilus assembly protein PilM
MPGMPYGMGMGMTPGDRNQPQLVTLTRTDFLIQFLWQPPTQEGPLKSPEERQAEFTTKVAEATKAMREAEAKKSNAVVTLPKEEAIESASKAASREVEKVLSKSAAPAGPAAAPATGAPAPGAPAAPPK